MQYNNRILIVDDNEAIHEDFRKVLCPREDTRLSGLDDLEQALFGSNESSVCPAGPVAATYEVDSAFQGLEAYEMAAKAEQEGKPYALIFMDVRMPPGWDGIETIARIWDLYPYAEIVICTAYSDYSWDEILAKLGSTDKLLFLKKPFDSVSVKQMALALVKKWNLDAQARNYVANLEREVRERTQQLQKLLAELENKNQLLSSANKELKHVALHDPLTNLPNRFLFNDRLQHEIDTSRRQKTRFAVAILDLDKFKEINDLHGHVVGDQVLSEVARRLKDTLRRSDTVARLGGDEFAIILPAVNSDAIDMVGQRVVAAIAPPVSFQEKKLVVGASLGIAFFPDDGDDDLTLLKCADAAMYGAKRKGGGYAFYDPDEDSRRNSVKQLVADLDDAIRNNGLELYYQPIISMESGQVCAMEALCRWNHPERGLIPPDEFIALAEKKGLIRALTNWVSKTAIEQCAEWHKQGRKISVSINFSTSNLLDENIPTYLANILSDCDLDGEWVTMEITESMTITNPERAFAMLAEFDKLGINISIDDYGTGYSSLAYLKKLPVDELKIDRCFVLDMDKDSDNQAIVKSTIDLAKNLGLRVVAEGIESEDVVQLLKAYGCDKAQGFFICKPRPAAEIDAWLEDTETRN